MSVIAVCSLKSGGSSTLALTLAAIAAHAGRPVHLIDAARNQDLCRWAALPGRPDGLVVAACGGGAEMEILIREGLKRGAAVVVDAGIKRERVRMAARLADLALIPVRFSPVSAYWATATDRMLRGDERSGRPRRHAFVATAIAQIPSRIARAVEAELGPSPTPRLAAGLALRAAFEAPFLFGGTIFTLPQDAAPRVAKAQGDALALAAAIGLLTCRAEPAPRRMPAAVASPRLEVFRPFPDLSRPDAPHEHRELAVA